MARRASIQLLVSTVFIISGSGCARALPEPMRPQSVTEVVRPEAHASETTAESLQIRAPPDVATAPSDAEESRSGLRSKVLEPGTGTVKPQYQDKVTILFTGWTPDGTMFESSFTRGGRTTVPVKGVIPGLTEGLQLMVVGEKRRFWIPAELGYTDYLGKPSGPLVYEVQLLTIIPGLRTL